MKVQVFQNDSVEMILITNYSHHYKSRLGGPEYIRGGKKKQRNKALISIKLM